MNIVPGNDSRYNGSKNNMRTLAALCHRTAQGQYAAAQQAAVLAPKLGLCGGLLVAILLWPAG